MKSSIIFLIFLSLSFLLMGCHEAHIRVVHYPSPHVIHYLPVVVYRPPVIVRDPVVVYSPVSYRYPVIIGEHRYSGTRHNPSYHEQRFLGPTTHHRGGRR